MNAQGIYGAGSVLLAFFDGKAYYKDFAGTSDSFTLIQGLNLDSTVDRIYAETIPESTINFAREKIGDGNSDIIFTTPAEGSPASTIITDGINQPIVLYSDGQWKTTQTYAEWTKDKREYVPVGTFPLFIDSVLYMAGKDSNGRLTRILRSVSGRPLDFVVNITVDGNKADVDEKIGGAGSTAYRIAYEELTCLARINAPGGAFFASTLNSSFLVLPRIDKLIFGEPTFSNIFLFKTGALNQASVIDILGDTALIDSSGIRSFNAVGVLSNEGRNSVFSRKIFRLFNNIEQTIAAAVNYDNYALFGLETIYGPAIVIFDTLIQQFVAVDIYPNVGRIKQFAEIKVGGNRKLFFITEDAELYEAFASATTATARFYFGDLSVGDLKIEERSSFLYSIFDNIKEDGTVQTTSYADHKKEEVKQKEVTAPVFLEDSREIPFQSSTEEFSEIVITSLKDTSKFCSRLSYMIEWNFDAMLSQLQAIIETRVAETTMQRITEINSNYTEENSFAPLVLCVTGNDGVASAAKLALVLAMKAENPSFILGTGNHNYPAGAEATRAATLETYWSNELRTQKALFALGNIDLDTLNGKAALDYYTIGSRYYKRVLQAGLCDLFVINSGMNTALALLEPDGNTISSTQYQWLVTELASSNALCKLVMFSHPGYSSVSQFADLQWRFRLLGASLCFCGFNSSFEHLFADSFHFFNIGLGGYSTLDTTPAAILSTSRQFYNEGFAYLKVTIDKFNAVVQLKSAAGEIIYGTIVNL